MKKVIFLWLGLAILLLLSQSSVHACSCIGDPTITFKQKVNSDKNLAQVVFLGKVVEIIPNPSKPSFITKLQVEKSWKNLIPKSRPQEIIITEEGTSCDFYFEVGKSYLVYASALGNHLRTVSCAWNSEFEKAGEQLKILGKGRKPQKSKS